MALVDDTGAVVERYKYTAFGVATIMDASYTVLGSSAHAWVHLHQGLRLEEASGLYDNRWRWYSAELGQFVSNDPIGFNAGDVNVRRYVGNGAVGAVDPSGLDMIFLYDREAAAGHGHAAILIMNQKGGWDYYSFAPAGKGSAVVSGLFFDVPVNEELFHIHFDSLIDAWKSDLLARYDKYIRYSADELDESLARKACEKYRGKDFAITNNCMNMTGSALKAARIDIDIRPIGDQHTDASGAGHVLLNDKDKKRLDTCASPMNTHARASKFGGRVQNADVWGFGKVGYNPGKEFNNPYYIRPLTGQFDKASTILVCP